MERERFQIEDIAPSGHGVALRKNGKRVSILGAFPGDEIEGEVYKEGKDHDYARIRSILSPSPDRRFTPGRTPFYDPNAPWEHLKREAEERYKKAFMEEWFRPFFPGEKIEYRSALKESGYRNKVAYPFLNDRGKLAYALYTRGDGKARKIPQTRNHLAHPLIEKVSRQFLHFFNQRGIRAEQLKYLILRYSFTEDALVAYLLVPETNRKKLPFRKAELESFLLSQEKLKGIVVAHSPADVRSALAEKTFYTLGDTELKEKMLDKLYSYHPFLFFQINPVSFQEILRDLRESITSLVPESHSLRALDLFAGVGLIGIELADLFREVTGVERSPLSKTYAEKNAKLNGIERFSFYESSVDDALKLIEGNEFLLLDPPRSGLSRKTREAIREAQPEYIAYVSCNPETQVRDYRDLDHDYEILKLKAYNLFPQTQHIESLLFLKKKK